MDLQGNCLLTACNMLVCHQSDKCFLLYRHLVKKGGWVNDCSINVLCDSNSIMSEQQEGNNESCIQRNPVCGRK